MLILDSSSINRPFDISRQNPALRQRRSQLPATIMADNTMAAHSHANQETTVTGLNATVRAPRRHAVPEDRIYLGHAGAGQGGRP
ncbi:protein of unknown function (plasmid) [Cupriavidus taiwanensis]|uniref:Uncharacterized protein n=1 Tax=Cupriavidus taiwanensis TaxID=164546 RepID=A0A9Q7UWI3_9BURK|nr:protein of unknown function [Cupriavidus taiwanensis]